jgi:GT2 family glycosyltransferase
MLQVNYLLEHPHIDYSIAKMRSFLESGMEWPTWLKKDQIESDVSAYIPSALLVRKTVFERIGNFDPTYRNANDADWFFRAKDAKLGIAIIPEVLVLRRIHSDNISHQTEAMQLELMRILRASISRKHQEKSPK